MARVLLGTFIILHGLVHVWYIVLSQKWVAFRPEMGWSGRSWLFTPLLGDPAARAAAAIIYALAGLGLVVGGISWLSRASWGAPVLAVAAGLSALGITLFWDGSGQRIIEKGLLGLLISLGLLAFGLMYARFDTEMMAARAHIAALSSQVAETPCGPVEYARVGSGEPVLVIHGNVGGFDHGLGMAQGYLDSGYEVIALSRFGYLRTPMPENASVEQQADAYACLLDALSIRRTAVFATSAGVTSAVVFALRHPERVSALVLHSPNAPAETVGLTPPPQAVFKTLMGNDFLWWACATYLRPVFQMFVGVPKDFDLTPQHLAEVKAVLRDVAPTSARLVGLLFDSYVGNPYINQIDLEAVAAPTLVISAVDDPMALHSSAVTLAERIPGARLLPIADGGHLMLGHTEEVRNAVGDFLQAQSADAMLEEMRSQISVY